jgi:hypothetical protein
MAGSSPAMTALEVTRAPEHLGSFFTPNSVIPTKVGIHGSGIASADEWIPFFNGMAA